MSNGKKVNLMIHPQRQTIKLQNINSHEVQKNIDSINLDLDPERRILL